MVLEVGYSRTKEKGTPYVGEPPPPHFLIQKRRTLNIKALPRFGQRSRAVQ
jgi:hypothetical protein